MTTVAIQAVSECPICGARERRGRFTGYDRLHGLPGHFPVVQCLKCQGCYLAERPLDLSAYYPAESYAAYSGDAKHFSRAPGRGHGLAQRRQWLTTLKPNGGRLLDVGCGSGDFLDLMRQVPGWQVAGLEPSPAAAEYARTVRALEVTDGELPGPPWPAASYDVIMMWHVLEHVPAPALTLAEVRRLLRPGGIFVLAVPVADSAEAQCFGPAWAGYDVPRHLMTFTRLNVTHLLTRSGFRVEEHFGVIQGFASLRLSLRWWLAEKGVRAAPLQAVAAALVLPPLFAYLRARDGRRVSVATMAAYRDGD